MDFEWDENKNQSNRLKHGVRFESALEAFDDPAELTRPAKMVNGERRFQTVGVAANRVLLMVVHTTRLGSDGRSVVRLISARQASKKERREYEQR